MLEDVFNKVWKTGFSKNPLNIEAQQLSGCSGVILSKVQHSKKFRVSLISGYRNKAGNPQVSWFMKDFDEQDDAETLYLEVLENNGGLAFGDEFRLSKGSGFRHYAHIS